MYTFGPLIAKNAQSGRLLGGAPVQVTTLDGTILDTYSTNEQPLTLVTNHEGYLPAFRADTDQVTVLARPRGGEPLPLYAREGVQQAVDVADVINTGRLSEASLEGTIATRFAALMAAGDASFLSDTGDPWDGFARSVAVANERDRLTHMFDAANNGTQVAVGRRGNHFDLYQHLGGLRWWRMALHYTSAAANAHHSLLNSVIAPASSADSDHFSNQDTAAWDYVQVTSNQWITDTNQFAAGGNYARTQGAQNHVTFTTPPETTAIKLHGYRTTNGGYALVQIDGGTIDASGLPTAQQEVDAGRLPASALVSGGGTLTPSDRLYNYHNATVIADHAPTIADNLPPGVHTVQITATGYRAAASTADRLYITGATVTVQGEATPAPTDPPDATILSGSSVYEYASTWRPAGGSTLAWIGNRHGNEVQTDISVALDGEPVTLNDGEVRLGSELTVTRDTVLNHPDAGRVGTSRVVYTMTPHGGLDVHVRIEWETAGTAFTTYLGMLPTQGNSFAKGRAATGPVVTLTDDDDSVKGSTRSDTLVLWQDGGKAATLATLRNLPIAVNKWRAAPTDHAWLQDRTGGDFNKAYFQRVQAGSSEPVASGDVWEAAISYRAAWMDSTAPLAT